MLTNKPYNVGCGVLVTPNLNSDRCGIATFLCENCRVKQHANSLMQQLIKPLAIGELIHRLEDQTGEKWVSQGDATGLPEGWTVEQGEDLGWMIHSPRVNGVQANTCVWEDSENPAERLLCMMLQSNRDRKPPAPAYPEKLPCDVHMLPGLKLGKGVPTRSLLMSLARREEYNATLEAMTDEEREQQETAYAAINGLIKAAPTQPPAPEPVGYFAYSEDSGFETFDTAEKASRQAQDEIDAYREDSPGEWPEAVDGVCWGVILQQAKEFNGDMPGVYGDCCDYRLEPLLPGEGE